MKVDIGAVNCLYPLPATIVGVLVNGKPNYLTIAHVGIMDMGSVSLGMGKIHYSNAGIKENGSFSVNLPSVKLVRQTDYCGLVSGKNKEKSEIFKTFFGKMKTAPMIEECLVNMECQLIKTVDFPTHDVFVGKVTNTYCDESVLTNGALDLEKLQPILFAMSDRSYWTIGTKLAKAWEVGKDLIK